jgi:hypothetical protein
MHDGNQKGFVADSATISFLPLYPWTNRDMTADEAAKRQMEKHAAEIR